MSNPLDTLAMGAEQAPPASAAASPPTPAALALGATPSSSLPAAPAADSLEAEEAAGGPPMPPSSAAVKPDLFHQTVLNGQEEHSSIGTGGAAEAGDASVGDAAMAAVDGRLDTGEMSHSNGFVEDKQDVKEGNEVDYTRLAGETGGAVPPMSNDVDQPAGPVVQEEEDQTAEKNLPVQNGHVEEQQAPAQPPMSMDALPDAPAPLPSQLVNHSAPTTSETQHQEGTVNSADQAKSASTEQSSTATAPSLGATETSQNSLPPASSSNAPLISPSGSKRPFEDSSDPNNYFGDSNEYASTAATEAPAAKKQRISASPAAQPAPPSDPASQIDQSLTSGTVDAANETEKDAEGEMDFSSSAYDNQPQYQSDSSHLPPAPLPSSAAQAGQEEQFQFGAEDMGQAAQIAQQPGQYDTAPTTEAGSPAKQEGDNSMMDQSMDPSINESSYFDNADQSHLQQSPQGQTQQVQSNPSASHSPSHLQQPYQGQDQQQQQLGMPPQQQDPQQQYQNYSESSLPPTVKQEEAKPVVPPAMPKEQNKYALSILRTMKKKSEATPFLHPVDPVALQIPHYVNIVQEPMDLSTVEKRVQQNYYKDIEEFKRDMRLIWENCYAFNGHEAQISLWAKTLSTMFEKQVQKMPTLASIAQTQALKRSESPAAEKKGKQAGGASGSKGGNGLRKSAGAGGAAAKKQQQQFQGGYDMDYSNNGMYGNKAGPKAGNNNNKKKQPAPQQQQMMMPQQQMNPYGHQMQNGMNQQAGPSNLSMSQGQGQRRGGGNINMEQLKFCKEVIKELNKKQHAAFVYPFLEPVDFVALGIPDYPKVIRRPMDLGTVKRKLDSGQYPNASAFEADFKLIVNNCFTYNPPQSAVHRMGEQMQAVFYDKWQALPQEHPQSGGGGWGGNNSLGYGGNQGEYYDEEDPYENEQIKLMQRQLELLTGNLEMMRSQARMKSGMGRPSPYGNNMGGMGMQQQQQQAMMQQPQHSPMQMSPPMHMQQQLHYGQQPPPQQQQQMQPPQPQVPIQPKPPRQTAPKQPKAAAPAKRKTSGSFSSSLPSAAQQANAPPKPRTTKRSSMAARADPDADGDWAPSPRAPRETADGAPRPRGRPPNPVPAHVDNGDSEYEDEGEPEATVTFDMKRELAEKIQEFDGPKLDTVVDIIRKSAPELLGDDNKEIELDIDMLDQRTLLKLYEYVVHPVGKGRQLKPKKNKVKGRNRGVDEVAEEERINALQAQLDAMSGNVASAAAAAGVPVPEMQTGNGQGGNRAADVASSSSEDEDDGSESESDGFDPAP